jgi:metal-dependent amidase/aminoacylase/carboxypeptidase family protein
VLDGVDAALMLHPADAELAGMDTLAVHEVDITYTGQAAHAAAFPEQGRNALDAAVLGYMAVAALRQHIGDGERIHGVITDGGDKPNIVPHRAASRWMVRSPTLAGLAVLKERFVACLQGGADAAGCTMEVGWHDVTYADMVDNRAIGQRYAANAAALGRTVKEPTPAARVVGSTDMGNVSYLAPSIHPMIKVAPDGVSIHTPDFARYAAGPEGDAAVLDGAKALAFTVADLWQDGGLVDLARAEWQAEVSVRGG